MARKKGSKNIPIQENPVFETNKTLEHPIEPSKVIESTKEETPKEETNLMAEYRKAIKALEAAMLYAQKSDEPGAISAAIVLRKAIRNLQNRNFV